MELPEEENLQLAPRVPPVPRRQNAVQVGVAEVEAPRVPPVLRRQNAVLGAVGASLNLAEALEFLARLETTQ